MFTFRNFLQFSCGIIRDIFCMLSAFLLQFHCGIFPRTIENIVAIIMHVICGCFRDFCEEVAETRADYMQKKSQQCVSRLFGKKPTVELQQKCRQHTKDIAKHTATKLQKMVKGYRIFCSSTAVLFAISFAGCRHFCCSSTVVFVPRSLETHCCDFFCM